MLCCFKRLFSHSFSSDVQLKKGAMSFKLRLRLITSKTNTFFLGQLADGLMWKYQVSEAVLTEQLKICFFLID